MFAEFRLIFLETLHGDDTSWISDGKTTISTYDSTETNTKYLLNLAVIAVIVFGFCGKTGFTPDVSSPHVADVCKGFCALT